MKTQSDVMPSCSYAVERISDRECEVVFITNVREVEQEGKIYIYDLYRLKTAYRQTLTADIEANYEIWLGKAIENEGEQNKIYSDKEKITKLENENKELSDTNKTQDELININMLATDEIFMMVEPLLSQTFNIKREVKNPMVDMYVAMVMRGLKTINEVPARYRDEVRRIIEQLEA